MSTPSSPEGSEPLPAPPRLSSQVWGVMVEMLEEMLGEAETSVRLRRVDLDAFDRKLSELSDAKSKAAAANLQRLSERRAALEEEVAVLEKHVDDLRFLAGSLVKLRDESNSRDRLQTEAMNQIKITEDARASLEVQVHQLKRARQELADVLAVVTGVMIPAPAPPDLTPVGNLTGAGLDLDLGLSEEEDEVLPPPGVALEGEDVSFE